MPAGSKIKKMKKKLFISCKEASHHIDKAQYDEASTWELFTYKLHILYCKFCRAYSLKNKKLTQLFKTQKISALSTEQKSKLKEKLSNIELDY